jgi:hypothetical protein
MSAHQCRDAVGHNAASSDRTASHRASAASTSLPQLKPTRSRTTCPENRVRVALIAPPRDGAQLPRASTPERSADTLLSMSGQSPCSGRSLC